MLVLVLNIVGLLLTYLAFGLSCQTTKDVHIKGHFSWLACPRLSYQDLK